MILYFTVKDKYGNISDHIVYSTHINDHVKGCHGRDCMIVGFTQSVPSPLSCEFESGSC
jgi:hypothetical protein